ncbi:MAG: hypothetical protein AB7U63_19785, partial [Porticoccaceae bacterium]
MTFRVSPLLFDQPHCLPLLLSAQAGRPGLASEPTIQNSSPATDRRITPSRNTPVFIHPLTGITEKS